MTNKKSLDSTKHIDKGDVHKMKSNRPKTIDIRQEAFERFYSSVPGARVGLIARFNEGDIHGKLILEAIEKFYKDWGGVEMAPVNWRTQDISADILQNDYDDRYASLSRVDFLGDPALSGLTEEDSAKFLVWIMISATIPQFFDFKTKEGTWIHINREDVMQLMSLNTLESFIPALEKRRKVSEEKRKENRR